MLGLIACGKNLSTENGNKNNVSTKHVNMNNDANGKKDNHKLSSMGTTMSSDNYPHTRAVLVQEARFQFVPLNPQGNGNEGQPQIFYGQAPFGQQGQPDPTADYQQIPNMQPNEAALPNNQQTPNLQPDQAAQPNTQQAPITQPKQAAQPNDQQAPVTQPKQAAQPKQQAKKGPAPKQQASQGISNIAQQVIDLTNAQRRQNGLPDLKADTQLTGVAQKKSEDMQQKHYFSHTSPTYGSPFDMMRDFGVTYTSAGENIAQGQPTPQEVVQAWMNSEGHRKNILSNNFTHIGIGYEQNGNYWTQMFIGK